MNNKQSDKHAAYFARQWLEELLTWCRGRRGFLHRLRTCGHMHGRISSNNQNISKFSLQTLIRLLVNIALECTEKEFMELWNKLGIMIYQYADEHGDEFNEQYAKHKQLKPKEKQ